ncbi:hypothetical protein CBDKU1_15590 [Clostridium butyricum DKU-01]|nr:hypothetical protein CBDKU1_15590 [Clostridium butyricum DKU-01]KIU07628.1 hypothetical protein SC08_Contig83orf01537 [Clostridium butyricum]
MSFTPMNSEIIHNIINIGINIFLLIIIITSHFTFCLT